MQAVRFCLNEKEFGINVNKIQEVSELPKVTRVTHSAPFLVGFVNIRGEIVAVIDTSLLLNLGKFNISKKSKIIIVNSNGIKCGFLVDEITGRISYEDKDVEAVSVEELGDRATFFEGILHKSEDDSPIALLSIENILKSKEFSVFS